MNPRVAIAHRCPRSPARRAGLLVLAAGLMLLAVACKPSSANDRKERMEEMREMDRLNASQAPPIPMSEAVGCDVCPGWCRWQDLSLEHLPDLLHGYEEQAEYLYGRMKQEIHRTQVAKDHVHRTACVVKRSGPEVWELFLSFMDEDLSPGVRLATADLALKHELALARPIEVLDTVWRTAPEELVRFAWGLSDLWRFKHSLSPPKPGEPAPPPIPPPPIPGE